MAENNLKELKHKKWFEETLRDMIEQKPEAVAIISKNADGDIYTAYTGVTYLDLLAFGGHILNAAHWMTMKENPEQLKEIIEKDWDSEEDEDEEDDDVEWSD